MLKQLWITGVFAAFSIFGIKAGLGLSAYIFNKNILTGKKVQLLSATFFTYFILFFSLFYVITSFNLIDYLDQIINMLKYGMLLHYAVAFGLLLWGVRLLFQTHGKSDKISSNYGLMLLFPCPVCATVILLNLSFAFSLFSVSSLVVTLTLFSIFTGIIFITVALVFPFRHRILSGSSFLGLSMVLVSLYFLFTVIIAPIYPEIKAAFTMAASNNPVKQINLFHTTILLVVLSVILGYGFIRSYFTKGLNK